MYMSRCSRTSKPIAADIANSPFAHLLWLPVLTIVYTTGVVQLCAFPNPRLLVIGSSEAFCEEYLCASRTFCMYDALSACAPSVS